MARPFKFWKSLEKINHDFYTNQILNFLSILLHIKTESKDFQESFWGWAVICTNLYKFYKFSNHQQQMCNDYLGRSRYPCQQPPPKKPSYNLIQPVEHWKILHFSELGDEGRKGFEHSKQSGHAKGQQTSKQASKRTNNNHKELLVKLRVTPKPVWGVTTDLQCFDLNLS